MPPPLIPQPMPMPMPMPALRTRTNVDPDPDADDPTADNLVNMYFLILGAFVILVMCSFWYWRRNKRKAREGEGGLPKYEEVVEGGATEEEVERVRRGVERGTTTGVEGEEQERQQQGTAEGEDETVRERTGGGGGGLVPGDRGGTETERAGSTSTPTPI